MNNLQPYSKYKPSGIAWLGDIPEHWEVRKLKYSLNINNGSDYKHIQSDSGYPVIGSGGQFAYAKEFMFDGEVVFLGRKGTIDKPLYFKGKFWAVDTMFYANGKNGNNVKFHYYVSTQIPFKLYSTSTALPSMTQTDLKEHYFAYPSLPEQTAIATFLDYKTAKIDRFIRKKKQLIKLLNEQKAGIINHAVTQGLNPNATTKPSGIEWLGDIPEHWEIVKLRYLARITTGNKNTEDRVENGQYDFFVRSQKIAKINSYSFDGEGILTAGDGVGVGKVFHYINGKCDYHQRVYLFYKFTNKVHVKYLFYFLQKFLKNELVIYNAKSTVDSVRLPVLKDFLVVLPSVPEQTAIVSHIETETAIINKTIATIEKEIALVQEYRTAIIAEAVTGKIDVREYAFSTIEEEETYEEWEEELNIAAEDEAEYNKQEAE